PSLFLTLPLPPISPPFPYTPLFRSRALPRYALVRCPRRDRRRLGRDGAGRLRPVRGRRRCAARLGTAAARRRAVRRRAGHAPPRDRERPPLKSRHRPTSHSPLFF